MRSAAAEWKVLLWTPEVLEDLLESAFAGSMQAGFFSI